MFRPPWPPIVSESYIKLISFKNKVLCLVFSIKWDRFQTRTVSVVIELKTKNECSWMIHLTKRTIRVLNKNKKIALPQQMEPTITLRWLLSSSQKLTCKVVIPEFTKQLKNKWQRASIRDKVAAQTKNCKRLKIWRRSSINRRSSRTNYNRKNKSRATVKAVMKQTKSY